MRKYKYTQILLLNFSKDALFSRIAHSIPLSRKKHWHKCREGLKRVKQLDPAGGMRTRLWGSKKRLNWNVPMPTEAKQAFAQSEHTQELKKPILFGQPLSSIRKPIPNSMWAAGSNGQSAAASKDCFQRQQAQSIPKRTPFSSAADYGQANWLACANT